MSASESRTSGVAHPRTAARVPSRDGAVTISLSREEGSSIEAIAARLPDPSTLEAGAMIVIPGAPATAPSLANAIFSVFGRGKVVPRALRCSALVLRGYVDVGAARDDEKNDLVWGYAPNAR